MRYLLFAAMLLSVMPASAQPPVKTIPGVFVYDLLNFDGESNNTFRVAPSGNTVATKDPYHQFIIIDVNKGATVKVNRNMPGISPDHRYLYKNDIRSAENDKGQRTYNGELRYTGVSSDTVPRTVSGPWYALGMDEQNNFIATKAEWNANGHIKTMRGIYRVDRTTGRELQALRTDADTLFTCQDYNGCIPPFTRLEKSYLVLAANRYAPSTRVLPFGKQHTVTISDNDHYTLLADSSFIYAIGSLQTGQNIKVYDALSGKLLAAKFYPQASGNPLKFVFSRNRIYSFNPTEGKVYEDQVTRDTITAVRSWNVQAALRLSTAQDWGFAVTKGPSLFFVPLSMSKGESGGMEANAASLFHTASGRLTLHIYPFYNRTPGDVAMQQKAMKEQNDFLEKMAKEKASNDPCKTGWNVPSFKRGLTRKWETMYVILMSFDCDKDEYKVWQPAQRNHIALRDEPDIAYTVRGDEFRRFSQQADKHYHTCTACEGDGSIEVTIYTTKTKELPWGYFSGIETKKITTTSRKANVICKTCHGRGVVFK